MSTASASPASYTVEFDVRIPLSDGVSLSANIYRPEGATEPAPCILCMTPYSADAVHPRAKTFAQHGLTFVVVDVRGRGNSGGVFNPQFQEMTDAPQVVEWLAAQPFCNGKVGMQGGSYQGYAQWCAAQARPPHLATIVPKASPRLGVDVPARNNLFPGFWVQWMHYTAGHGAQKTTFMDNDYWLEGYRRWRRSGRPFRELFSAFGVRSDVFQTWCDHPEVDAYWDAGNPSDEAYAAIDIPILTVTGIYDDDQPGALDHFKRHNALASPEARNRHYLVIGPWDHGGVGVPRKDVGGLVFGDQAVLNIGRLQREWYAWTMVDGPKPIFLEKKVSYYVAGADRWRYADSLEAVTRSEIALFLDSPGTTADLYRAGSLSAKVGVGPHDSYTYDPRIDEDVQPVETWTRLDAKWLATTLKGVQLIYVGEPLPEDLEVSGFFRLDAWLSIDCPDTDFYVSVYELCADGTIVRLSSDVMRARYRNDLRKAELIETSEPLLYCFNRFTFTSRLMKVGSRLCLVVAPKGLAIETIMMQPNFNAGGAVADETREDGRAVTVQLHHDAVHPSRLYVPLGGGCESVSGDHQGYFPEKAV